MLFTSPVFLFGFLPLVLAMHYLAPTRLKNAVLLFASLLFYTWGETLYVLLMLVSILANYCFGLAIDHSRQSRYPRLWLAIGVATNLVLLAAFKYANFLVDNSMCCCNGRKYHHWCWRLSIYHWEFPFSRFRRCHTLSMCTEDR